MKKFFTILISLIFIFLISIVSALLTIGIETERFNKLILNKINQIDNKINVKINTIKFKLDINEFSLFLETSEPNIFYRDILIPTEKIKVYVDFFSIIKTKPKIKRINILSKKLNIKDLKNINVVIKPSNLKSFLKNNVKNGNLILDLAFYLDTNNSIDNFIVRGQVTNFNSKIFKEIFLQDTRFEFFGDKSIILFKKINGEINGILVKDGDIKLTVSPEISIISNFNSDIKYQNSLKNGYSKLLKKFENLREITEIEAVLKNNLKINFDKTYKIKDYNLSSRGEIIKGSLKIENPLSSEILQEKIDQFSIIDTDLKIDFDSKSKNFSLSGKYSTEIEKFLNYNIKGNIEKDFSRYEIDAEIDKKIDIKQINYSKKENLISNLSLIFEISKKKLNLKKLLFVEDNNKILVDDLLISKGKPLTFKRISTKTYKEGSINNDFLITVDKKIKIKGSKFDATNLPKIITTKNKNNNFSNFSKEIEIDLDNVIAPLSENLKNFKLIGYLDKGEFAKISAKGDFGKNNFLDISLKNDKKKNRRYLEIYSDLTSPLLTEFKFFKGLSEGKLLYTSIINGKDFNSKLKIEDFKVTNAPGLIKLLSLADLGGLADLAKGEGLSFDSLEIEMSREKGFLKIIEILALGPSISVLMEGYRDQNEITSLRGTLVPAKNLNKLISKIPIIGDIVIPKDVGEGLFGISFKMKGPPGRIKTSINPIRTLTPRFIQKIVDRKKKVK